MCFTPLRTLHTQVCVLHLGVLVHLLGWEKEYLQTPERDCGTRVARLEHSLPAQMRYLAQLGEEPLAARDWWELDKDFSCNLLMYFNLHVYLPQLRRLCSDTLSILPSGTL